MDEYIAKRGRRIEQRVGDIEAIAEVLTTIDQYDRAVEAEALDAFERWYPWPGERPEVKAIHERVWLAAWWACREAMQRPDEEADQTPASS